MLVNKFLKFLKLDGEPGAAGGTGQPAPKQGEGQPAPKPSNELESIKAQNAELIKRLEAMESRFKPASTEPDLSEKTRIEREAAEKKSADQKKIATALKFTMGSPDWLKNNATLLPKTIPDLFVKAEKETYESEIEKADAIKVGIVNEFFAVQGNLDLLTESQKNLLEDWKKLTKNEKQDRVHNIYDLVFEPSFERLRGQRKAEQLSKGLGDSTHFEDAYKKRLMEISRKHYLGEK